MASFNGVPDPSFSWRPTAAGTLDLAGKHLLVVGGTDGLGRAIARLAVTRGARVTVVGRTFRDEPSPAVTFVKADLSSMREAERLGETLPSADVTLLTTGIIAGPTREVTAEGIERDMAVSFLSRLVMLRPFVPRLPARSRVFVMGMPGAGMAGTDLDDLNAERRYEPMALHGNTVAGNEMLVLDWARRAPGVGFHGLNPGLIKTNIRANLFGEGTWRHRLTETLIGWFMLSAEGYAARTLPLLFAPELDGRTGLLFNQKAVAIRPTEGMTPEHVAAFLAAASALADRANAA